MVAQKGQNGFKLSLRGYDAVSDVRAFTDDLAARRVNFASPDDSLMLLKPTAGVPHQGGQVMKYDEPYYNIVRDWIASGANLDLETPRVTRCAGLPGKSGDPQDRSGAADACGGDLRGWSVA